MEITLVTHERSDNEYRDDIIEFISNHNNKFAEYTLIESARRWNLIPNIENKSDEEIIEGYYERLFGIVLVAKKDDKIIGIASFRDHMVRMEVGWTNE